MPDQRTAAHAEIRCHQVVINRFRAMLFDPLLDPSDKKVAVVF